MTSLPHRVKTLLQSLNLRLDLFEEFLYCLIAGDGTAGRTFQIAINIICLILCFKSTLCNQSLACKDRDG